MNVKRAAKNLPPFTPEEFEIEDVQTPEPLANCLQSVKQHIQGLCEKLGTKKYKTFVGYGECHRHEILMPEGRRYKQNRDGTTRAIMVNDVKEYLLKHHYGERVEGIETDDHLSILTWQPYLELKEKSPYIVVTRDKDQGGCNGWWYNSDWMEEPMFVDGLGELWLDANGNVKGYGRRFKYYQLLVGDDSDGFKPSNTPLKKHKYGEKTAIKLLSDLYTDRECVQAIVKQYREWMPEPETYTAWNGEQVTDNWISWLDKHFQFTHMLRFENDKIDVPTLLRTMGCLSRDEIKEMQ